MTIPILDRALALCGCDHGAKEPKVLWGTAISGSGTSMTGGVIMSMMQAWCAQMVSS